MQPTGRRFWYFFAIFFCAAACFSLWWTARAQVSREQLQQILCQSPSAIIVCNRDGEVIFANERLYTYTGFTLADLQKDGLQTIIPADMYADHAKGFARAASPPHVLAGTLQYRKVVPVRCVDGKYIKAVIQVSTIVNAKREYDFYAFITPLPPEPLPPVRLDREDFKDPPLPTHAPATSPATGALVHTQ